jgi:hypothetical protein
MNDHDIIAHGKIAVAQFALVEIDGAIWGRLELTLLAGDATALLSDIMIDLSALSRNDPSAVLFPSGAPITPDRIWELTWLLLPHLRLLTRARVVPLEETLRLSLAALEL